MEPKYKQFTEILFGWGPNNIHQRAHQINTSSRHTLLIDSRENDGVGFKRENVCIERPRSLENANFVQFRPKCDCGRNSQFAFWTKLDEIRIAVLEMEKNVGLYSRLNARS